MSTRSQEEQKSQPALPCGGEPKVGASVARVTETAIPVIRTLGILAPRLETREGFSPRREAYIPLLYRTFQEDGACVLANFMSA